jgi:ribonuclease BN (tRNA processing enzyme)
MLDVCLLGTGGMMPLPNRWLTSLLMRYNGKMLLVDCGEGTQIPLKMAGWGFKAIEAIFFTHYHADHISGLPGLLLTIGNSGREEPLHLIGPPGLRAIVKSLLAICPSLPFDIRLYELPASRRGMGGSAPAAVAMPAGGAAPVAGSASAGGIAPVAEEAAGWAGSPAAVATPAGADAATGGAGTVASAADGTGTGIGIGAGIAAGAGAVAGAADGFCASAADGTVARTGAGTVAGAADGTGTGIGAGIAAGAAAVAGAAAAAGGEPSYASEQGAPAGAMPSPLVEIPLFGSMSFSYLPANHNMPCLAYSFSISRAGEFYPDRAKALGVPVQCWKVLQSGESVVLGDGRLIEPEMVLGEARKGIKLSYCTDSRPTSQMPQLFRASDLLVCEGLYGDDAELDNAAGKKHMVFSEAARLAKRSGVSELWLTHYSPAMQNPFDYAHVARAIFPNTKPGKDLMSATLVFK